MGIYKPKGQSLVVPSAGDLASVILGTQTSNLLGYYKCDDASGSLTDSSSNSNDLAVQGSGATYGIAGLNGDAVNGNSTQGWNNNGTPDTGVSFMVGDNGFTLIQFVQSAGSAQTTRIVGYGSSQGNFQCYDEQHNASGNRGMQSVGNAIFDVGNMNNTRASFLDDTTNFFMVGIKSDLGGGTSGDDALQSIKNGVVVAVNTTPTFTAGTPARLDVLCVNSVIITNDLSIYGGWDQQHVCFWDSELTDAEILAIAEAAGTT